MAAVGTVIFDFDSTVIDRESLDELLGRLLDEEQAAAVRAITDAGMDGRIGFRQSLESRLDLARPTLAQVEALGREAAEEWITPGLEQLIATLDAEFRIVSGGLFEAILPTAERLGIPAERIMATRARWADDGRLDGLAECHEKTELLRGRSDGWARPRILVGDGMTDYEPFREGLVDHFIAFTGHARRDAVVATGAPEAGSVRDLEYLLARLS